MTVVDGVLSLIGRTPLVRLNAASEETGCEILGKAEFMNPGGSVKDRAALGIVRDAERRVWRIEILSERPGRHGG